MPLPAGEATSVVVTGVGATTPLGGDAPSTWSAMLAGRSGARPLPPAWADALPVRIAARAAAEPGDWAGGGGAVGRSTRFLLEALREAWADAGFTGAAGGPGMPPPGRVGVSVGTGIGDAVTLLAGRDALASGGPGAVTADVMKALVSGGAAVRAGALVGAGAGAHTLASACAAGAEAIAYGATMIRSGRADVVVAGGTEAIIHPLAIAAFARMSSLSRRNDEPERASRPYDKNRDGFVLGEGAGVVVLESARHAHARRARVYCRLAGAGMSGEGHSIVQPDTSGRGMREALRHALADARLAPSDVTYVNAHATSTRQGDLAESRALVTVLGPRGYCVSATKSMTGHLIGAAGAAEAVVTVLSLRDRVAPPTINVDDLDDAIEADIVRGEPRPLPPGALVALSNSAGFGGHNVVLAFAAG